MPQVKAHIVPGAGHGSPIEQPEAVSRLILEFL
jgi:pimeloyl-ACP methyl ester carboxylesterase